MGNNKNNTMEDFIMLRLKQFLSKHLACDLNVVDTIIVEYLVSVIEDIGSVFDVEDFLEMMNAYIPGFDGISDAVVTEWLFDVAEKIKDGSWSDDVAVLESELEKWEQMNVGKDENNNAPSIQQTIQGWGKAEVKKTPSKLRDDGMLQLDLSQMPGEDWFTAPSVASNDLFPNPEKMSHFPTGDIVFSSPRKSPIPDFTDCEPERESHELPEHLLKPNTDLEPGTVKYSDKIDQLKEMFPLIPENQLKRCLSKSKSNVARAVQAILANQNDRSRSLKLKEKDADQGASGCTAEDRERDIHKLMDMFPKLTESRIRNCYNIVGNSCERAMREIISEEQSRDTVNQEGDRFKAHVVSFKKKELSAKEEVDLRKEISKKYSYYVDDPEKDHHPVVLVKKDQKANKISNIFDDKNSEGSVLCTREVEDKTELTSNKQNSNPKLSRKQRYR